MDPHKLYMVRKRRFSALKWYLVCENWLRIEDTGAKVHFKIKRIQQTKNYDVTLQNDVMTPLATLFAQTPVVSMTTRLILIYNTLPC